MKYKKSTVQPVKDRLFWSVYIDLYNDRMVPTNRSGICDNFYGWLKGHPTYSAFFEEYTNEYVVDLYREDVRQTLEPQHILDCMKNGTLCAVNYCTKTSSGNQRRLTITVVPADPDFESGKCVITASSIDNEYNILLQLEEQEEKYELAEHKSKAQDVMLQSLDAVFYSISLLNLPSHKFQEIISGEGIHPAVQDVQDAQTALNLCIDLFVSDSDKSYIRDFFDLSSLSERIGSQKSISAEFFGKSESWVRVAFLPVLREADNSLVDVLLVSQIIDEEKNATLQYQTALKNALDDAMKLAETDGMTQLLNRRSGEKYINQYLDEGSQGMFCLFDVDKFKHFNDDYGHAVGDKVLQGVSACMKQTFRNVDVLVRAGGDEFVIFAIGFLDQTAGEKKLLELSKRVSSMQFDEFKESVSISIGAVYTTEHENAQFKELFQLADDLMYKHKVSKKCQRR